MYFSIYPSSEYFSEEDDAYIKKIHLDEEQDEICIICWLPSDDNNKIQLLTDFKQITQLCKCHPNLHKFCLEKWIRKSSSCPVCRTKLTINLSFNENKSIFIIYYVFCIENTLKGLKFLCYLSFINLLCIFIYNINYVYLFYSQSYETY